MAAGRPVVGTATGGTPEIIQDGENGYVVPRKDAIRLADAIIRILMDAQLSACMGEASHRILAGRFDTAQILAQQVEFYRQMRVK